MIDKDLRQKLDTYFKEKGVSARLLSCPDFDKSIIGISENNRVVYSLDKMIREFMEDNDCYYEVAMEYIEYNTLRSLDYIDLPPIIIRTIDKLLE